MATVPPKSLPTDTAEIETLIPYVVGQEHRIVARLTAADIEKFAALSGDTAPLHTDAAFAQRAGFDGRLVHGALLIALVSRLVGMGLPGSGALLERIDLSFRRPCYAPCDLHLTARVRQVSESVSSLILDLTIEDPSGTLVASGKTWHRILHELDNDE